MRDPARLEADSSWRERADLEAIRADVLLDLNCLAGLSWHLPDRACWVCGLLLGHHDGCLYQEPDRLMVRGLGNE